MRQIISVATGIKSQSVAELSQTEYDLFVVCVDGTLWKWDEAEGDWEHWPGPGEGVPGRKPITEEEALERLRQTGRRFYINVPDKEKE